MKTVKPDLSIIKDDNQPLENQEQIKRILTKKLSMRHDSLSGFPQPAFVAAKVEANRSTKSVREIESN